MEKWSWMWLTEFHGGYESGFQVFSPLIDAALSRKPEAASLGMHTRLESSRQPEVRHTSD